MYNVVYVGVWLLPHHRFTAAVEGQFRGTWIENASTSCALRTSANRGCIPLSGRVEQIVPLCRRLPTSPELVRLCGPQLRIMNIEINMHVFTRI